MCSETGSCTWRFGGRFVEQKAVGVLSLLILRLLVPLAASYLVLCVFYHLRRVQLFAE